MKHFSKIVLTSLSLLSLSVSASADVMLGKDIQLGNKPTVNAEAVEGQEGKPTLIYYGSIKCPRCTEGARKLSSYGRQAKRLGVAVVGVQSEPVAAQSLIKYASKNKYKFPFYAWKGGLKPKTTSGSKYLNIRIPAYFVVDEKGKFVGKFSKLSKAKSAMKKVLQSMDD